MQSSPWESRAWKSKVKRLRQRLARLGPGRCCPPALLPTTQPPIQTDPRMAMLRSFLPFLALLGACLAVSTPSSHSMATAWLMCCWVPQHPVVDQAGVAVDSRIDARSTVQGVVCGDNAPWGYADGRRLKYFSEVFPSQSGNKIMRPSGRRCDQISCFDSVPGTVWVCLREKFTIVSSGARHDLDVSDSELTKRRDPGPVSGDFHGSDYPSHVGDLQPLPGNIHGPRRVPSQREL